jgi:arginase family enzyme
MRDLDGVIGAARLAEIQGVFDEAVRAAAVREERGREAILYGDVPTFMEVEHVVGLDELVDADAAIIGFGFEGITSLSPTRSAPPTVSRPPRGSIYWRMGADEAPAAIRKSSIFYSRHHNHGYFPEIDPGLVLHDELRIVDYGDVEVDRADVINTLARCSARVTDLVDAGALPIVLGGDHTTPYPALRAIAARSDGRIGVVVFDAHIDFSHTPDEYWASNQWPQLILETGKIDPCNISIVGIRSNRSGIEERRVAEALGVHIFTIEDVKQRGIGEVIDEAIACASDGVDGIYASLDIDCMEPSLVPGQKAPEIWGMTIDELMAALRAVAREPLLGFDVCELGPDYDVNGLGAQFCARAVVEVLAGAAMRRRRGP